MKTIWKFILPPIDDFLEIQMPIGAQILTVQTQQGHPCIWALVEPNNSKEHRRFRLAGTGHPMEFSEAMDYVGTFQIRQGTLVFHLFSCT